MTGKTTWDGRVNALPQSSREWRWNFSRVIAGHSHGALLGLVSSVGTDTQLVTAYVRDSLSRITRLVEKVQGVTHDARFTYDTAGRLSTVTRDGVLATTYAYDANGNRLSKVGPGVSETGVYDDQDRMLSYGTAGYTYGANGELQTKVVGTDTTKYSYDALGNLTHVALPNGTAIDYLIDAQNRRIGKKVNGTLVQGFLYQGQLTPVAELDSTGTIVSRFVYATGINVPDFMVKGGVTYRLLRDHLGSVRLVVDVATGTVAQRIDYDEFGIETQNTNPGFQPFGYAGGLTDASTGLVRFGARDYEAVSGRWTAKDQSGFGGGQNLYCYADADPINKIDPKGRNPILIAVGVGLVSGVVNAGQVWITNPNATVGDLLQAFGVGFAGGFVGAIVAMAAPFEALTVGGAALLSAAGAVLGGATSALTQYFTNPGGRVCWQEVKESAIRSAIFAPIGGAVSQWAGVGEAWAGAAPSFGGGAFPALLGGGFEAFLNLSFGTLLLGPDTPSRGEVWPGDYDHSPDGGGVP